MGRLKPEFLEQVESFVDRSLDVVDVLMEQRRNLRILDQLTGAATSVGANVFEADEAMSRADFRRCLGIAMKELNESFFWLRLCVRRGWVTEVRMMSLQAEVQELKSILGTILMKTRLPAAAPPISPARTLEI